MCYNKSTRVYLVFFKLKEEYMDLLLIIVPLILIFASQSYINSSYKKYSIYDIKSN